MDYGSDWKEVVVNSLIDDYENQKEAHHLKISKIPGMLYRYRSISDDEAYVKNDIGRIVDTMKNGGVWASKITEFNDLLEFRSAMSSEELSRYVNS